MREAQGMKVFTVPPFRFFLRSFAHKNFLAENFMAKYPRRFSVFYEKSEIGD